MSRAALVVIDVQESFRQRPIWAYVSRPDVVDRVGRLVAHARARGDLVIWVLHAEPGSGGVFDPALGHVRLIDGAAARAGGADAGQDRAQRLHHHEPPATAHHGGCPRAHRLRHPHRAVRRDHHPARLRPRLPDDVRDRRDGHLSHPAPRPAETATPEEILADPRTMSTAEMTARTEYALAGRFAVVRTVDEVTGDPATTPDHRTAATAAAPAGDVAS